MTYCNTAVEHLAHLDAGFSSKKTLKCSMRQVFRDRVNGVGPQDNILQTPSARFFAPCRRSCCPRKMWCGRRDLNPHGPFKPCGFSYRLRLSPPERWAFEGPRPGLRSGLSLHHPPQNPELRCCPSSLYTFPAGVSLRAWLGIAI